MKKVFLFAAAALLAAGAMNAKTIDEVRVYLNAGHGSWGPNDRPMATIPYPALSETGRPDTCGFYESNTNLWKVLKLGNTLEKMGVKHENIMYSRVKNGPYPYVQGAEDAELYNRALSEISTEVEANNIDMFLSVHSNAATEGTSTNYPLFLYAGKDGNGNEMNAGSYNIAAAMWPLLYTNAIDVMSYYSPTQPNLRGDISFYGSSYDRTDTNSGITYNCYLGVLHHGAPGFLSEGYFHTYQPARHRALNPDYCGQEGVRYARGICKYFGGTEETTGYIMGTVKDLHERIQSDLFKYAAGSIDQWLPINGAVVTLYKGGDKVAKYTVDNNYNGVFVFEGIAPGEYTLDVTAEGYKPLFDEYKAPITVKANETTYPIVYLESETYEPPKIVYTDFPDEINNPAITVASEYNFGTSYREAAIAELEGKTVRRSVLRGNNLYVLAIDEAKAPYIYVIDATTHAVLKTIGTEGTEGTELAVSDIAVTADGVLVGCSMELCHYNDSQVKEGETRGEVNVYKWENGADGIAEGNPAIWFKSMASGNFYRAYTGSSMLYKGTLAEGTIVMTSRTATAVKIFNNMFTIVDGQQVSYGFNNKLGAAHAKDVFGDDYTLNLSPLDADRFIISGSKHVARQYGITETTGAYVDLAEGLVNVPSAKVSFFKYAGHSLMVTGDVVDEKPVVKIIDITDGLDHAKLVAVKTTDEATAAAITAAGLTTVTKDDDGLVTAADIDLVTVNEGGTVTKLTTAGTEQPKNITAYAYDLKAEQVGDNVNFAFKISAAAKEVAIRVYSESQSAEEGEEAGEIEEEFFDIPMGALDKGEHSYSASTEGLPVGKYTWGVAVESNTVGTPTLVYAGPTFGKDLRGGVAVDNDPESPLFGNVYVSKGKSSGLKVYDAQLNEKGTYLADKFTSGNTSSPLRIAVSNSKVYLTDWSDAHSGLWMFDPQSGSDDITNVFVGTRESSGRIVNAEGVAVGGSSTGVAFRGKGEDRQMFVFCEDYPTGNEGNKTVRYDIGTADTWDKAPSAVFPTPSAKMINTNVEVNLTDNGFFLSQIRGAGNNNTGAPAFVFSNYDGDMLFNAGNMTDLNGCQGGGLAIDEVNNVMYIVDGNANIRVYDIYWTETGAPEFNFKYSFSIPGATEINQLKLDYAGNLLAVNRVTGLMVVALPRENAEVVTPGQGTLISTGVDAALADKAGALSVYPNPATDVVTVEAGEEIESIAVYNLAGAMIAAPANIEGNKATVNVENLAAGSYIVKVNKQAAQLIKK